MSPELKPNTVLIADDDEVLRALARWVVENSGARAVTARDGVEAVTLFRERPNDFCLVLMDLTMPRMSGEEVLVELRKIRADVPIILVTGYGESSLSDREREYMAGLLQKPFSPDSLKATIAPFLPKS